MTSKEFLANMHVQTDRRISFNTYITRLRRRVALQTGYILSAVNYDDIILDMVDLGLLPHEVITQIEFEVD